MTLARPTVVLLTGPGRSAIAVVRVSGDLSRLDQEPSLFQAANHRRAAEQSLHRICFGAWGAAPAEELVFCRTSEHSAELCCHGGRAAIERIIISLEERGFVSGPSAGDESTRSSLWSAVTQARTQRTADLLLEQTTGLCDQELAAIADLPPAQRIARVAALARWSEFAEHLTTPWEVVLCGPPNAGKSSLMNAIAGFTRSIVSEEPGTTRDLVTLETAIDGWPVRLTDSAGLRASNHPLEREGIDRARMAIAQADLALVLVDRSQAHSAADLVEIDLPTRRLTILPKADLPGVCSAPVSPECVSVSSVTGQGIAELLTRIASTLVPELPAPGTPLPVTFTQRMTLEQFRPTE